MSFASEVKKEINNLEGLSPCCVNAMLLGLLQAAAEINITNLGLKLVLKFPLLNTIKLVIPLLKDKYGIQIDEGLHTTKNTLGHKYYYIEIKNNAQKIIEDFALMPYDDIFINHPFLKKPCCKASFIRGLFIVKGSINDPRKECYHFEINLKKESIAKTVQEIMNEHEIEAKIINKGQNSLIYIKKSEHISNSLALMKASSGVFYFEDSRIYRDFYNQANRLANCDAANARRTAESCRKQLEIIKKIKAYGYFNKMPIRLQLIAIMREDYPDSPLEELAEYSDKVFGKTLSKSGISHCMRDLMAYYKSLNIKEK